MVSFIYYKFTRYERGVGVGSGFGKGEKSKSFILNKSGMVYDRKWGFG